MENDRQKVEGSSKDRKGFSWTRFDITPEIVIIGLVLVAFLAQEKEIYIAVVAGLTGYLAKKNNGG